jgi:hypothetical protein
MKPAVAAERMKIDDFQNRPVFEKMRADPVFVEAFEREFNRRIIEDLEARTPPKSQIEAEEEGDSVLQTAIKDKTVH